MVDFRLLNGKPRATLIQRFDGTVLVLGPKDKNIEFPGGVTLHEIQTKVARLGWVIGVDTCTAREKPELFRFFVLGKDNHPILQSKRAVFNDLKKDIQSKTFPNEANNEGFKVFLKDDG